MQVAKKAREARVEIEEMEENAKKIYAWLQVEHL